MRAKYVALVGGLAVVIAVLAFVIGYFSRKQDKDCPAEVQYSKRSAIHSRGVDSISAKKIEENLE